MQVVDMVTIAELTSMAEKMYGNMIKATIDIKKNVLVVDIEMHADGEQKLLENGSDQRDIWGINLYPSNFGRDDFVEFDSLINIRPRQKNMSRDIEDPEVRRIILKLIALKIKP